MSADRNRLAAIPAIGWALTLLGMVFIHYSDGYTATASDGERKREPKHVNKHGDVLLDGECKITDRRLRQIEISGLIAVDGVSDCRDGEVVAQLWLLGDSNPEHEYLGLLIGGLGSYSFSLLGSGFHEPLETDRMVLVYEIDDG